MSKLNFSKNISVLSVKKEYVKNNIKGVKKPKMGLMQFLRFTFWASIMLIIINSRKRTDQSYSINEIPVKIPESKSESCFRPLDFNCAKFL